MLSDGETLQARRLQARGMSYKAIARHMHRRIDDVVQALKKHTTAPRGRHAKTCYAANGEVGWHAAGISQPHHSARIPPHVLAERERALHAPLSLTAFVFGDPPAGRSALDRRDSNGRTQKKKR